MRHVLLLPLLAFLTMGMGQVRPQTPYEKCMGKAYTECSQYGNPGTANTRYFEDYAYDSMGRINGVKCVTNAELVKRLQPYMTAPNANLRKDYDAAKAGDPQACATRSAFDSTKPEYRAVDWRACANRIEDTCRCEHRPEWVADYNTNKTCGK